MQPKIIGRIPERLRQKLLTELDNNSHLWNEHRYRTIVGPHVEVDDIWVRYNPIKNLDITKPERFGDEHFAEWYPCIDRIKTVREIIGSVASVVNQQQSSDGIIPSGDGVSDPPGPRIGGVLITRLPPSKQVYPHIDDSWHARYYHKYAISIKAHPDQVFVFGDNRVVMEPCDILHFDNDETHSVENNSDIDRIVLFICLKFREN